MPQRIAQLKDWLNTLPEISDYSFEPASGDASFRRYFRIGVGDGSYIAMDAPTDKEDTKPFIQVANAFERIGLNVPHIHAMNLEQGFLLLEDLGDVLYLDRLNPQTVDRLYGDALAALVTLQACGPSHGLPRYDRSLLINEMELFRDWLLEAHLNLQLSQEERQLLDELFQLLAENALQQPQVCVHRDYHSRNLMVVDSHNPGVIDFQDAVIGPVTYDLVSLLKDCYIEWPADQVEAWAMGYFESACKSGVLTEQDESSFLGWFDLMGVQRHLKASGIFARLNRRDGKPGYLQDIPRTLGYILGVADRYPATQDLGEFLRNRVMPGL
ncbi:MAG: phosphotransferase [Candidatus Thiodiazotropha lotti]|uniref:Aminoglycoside phosphotransferase n=1 Tax=Candidatus Thiodiazotropha endoloripes TaxID=1818881 RepID=A0A1E2ULN3_9GAMM|nr:phosphotransferase [Candidatus Thiodiazotropha endoloripes]MCG7898083.1 phosphotransferase [Candidatus Thiodiazotropha weberae]MCG7991869.1 phosphotransferase [Candidatus Thiodiazotropha lotti]MCG7901908.1 phosphotransferase [Candidatus Thiodiazotropha weberae]MCG7913000.1 phosphotransferase [Candidatus Thiodiazotropha weberae]MCG7998373.1 phosphotransferase [Candidatus Thiodiazotropha lotti]